MDLSIDSTSIHLFIRLFIGCILLSTGVGKLRHPMRFQNEILDYNVFPFHGTYRDILSGLGAFVIPLAEILAGLGLISNFLLLFAIVLALGLFILFTSALLMNLLRGRKDLSCHCGGMIGDHRISWWMVARNLSLIIVLLLLAVLPQDVFSLETLIQHPSYLSVSMWVNVALPITLIVLGVLIVLVIVNAARIALATY